MSVAGISIAEIQKGLAEIKNLAKMLEVDAMRSAYAREDASGHDVYVDVEFYSKEIEEVVDRLSK